MAALRLFSLPVQRVLADLLEVYPLFHDQPG
jgi:hypothetical protein